jgi:hypothetical protein
MFLAPLTARSKVREVLRGLVATRQVHTISLGHAPQFYVAGTLPEFAAPPTAYASSSMPASTYFLRSYEHEDEAHDVAKPAPSQVTAPTPTGVRNPVSAAAEPAARPHFSRQPARSRDRKPSQISASGRVARPSGRKSRGAAVRSTGARTNSSSRHAPAAHWAHDTAKSADGKHNGTHAQKSSASGSRFNGNGHVRPARPFNGVSSLRNTKPSAARSLRSGHATARKSTAKPAARPASGRANSSRPGLSGKDARPDVRNAHGSRKPAMSASTKAGNRTRYGFTASSGQRTKKRG